MIKLFWLVLLMISITACNPKTIQKGNDENSMNTNQDIVAYEQITAKDAKNIMDNQEGYAIVDVRTEPEYDASHIEDAILLPLDEINEEVASDILPDKDQQLLVYCRSGVRSKQAASQLAELGYTNIKEFGGILDWPYDVVR